MKALVHLLLLLAPGSFASGAPSFDRLAQATTWLDAHIATGDRSQMLSRCAEGGRCRYLSAHPEAYELLRAAWQRVGPFEQLYAKRKFPSAARTFKLGGHDSELGHVHIDFVRTSDGWKLKDVWNCR